MKTISFLLLILSNFIGFSQQNNINLKSENLRGHIQSYQNKTFIVDNATKTEILKYNEKYLFNINGMINSIENFGDDAILNSKEIYEYKNEKISVLTTYNALGHVDKSTLYEYDDEKRLVTQKKINNTGKLQYHTTYLYSRKGFLVGQHKLIPSINYTMKESYAYDSQGQMIEKAKIARIGTTKETFLYNEIGQQIKKSDFNAMGELFSVITYTFNSYNDKTDLKKYDADGTMTYFESYKYTYDENGNWIERISFEKGEKVSIEKRVIVYLK